MHHRISAKFVAPGLQSPGARLPRAFAGLLLIALVALASSAEASRSRCGAGAGHARSQQEGGCVSGSGSLVATRWREDLERWSIDMCYRDSAAIAHLRELFRGQRKTLPVPWHVEKSGIATLSIGVVWRC